LYILPPKKEVSARATWEGALLEKFLFFFSRVRQFFCAGEREEFFFPPPPPKFFFEEEQLTHHFRRIDHDENASNFIKLYTRIHK